MDTFTIAALGLLFLLMALCAWWAFNAYKKARWVQFTLAVALLVILGFTWNIFPMALFLLLAPIFGWSFT